MLLQSHLALLALVLFLGGLVLVACEPGMVPRILTRRVQKVVARQPRRSEWPR